MPCGWRFWGYSSPGMKAWTDLRCLLAGLVVLVVVPLVQGADAAGERGVRTILCFGDSLTAGYGLDPEVAWPALLQERINAEGLDWSILAGGVSGDTSAGGLRRIGWMLRRPVDIIILALGSNDGLRGVDLETTRQNLQGIIDRVRQRNPEVTVVVAGMLMPPNLGLEYTEAFQRIFPELAEANDAVLIPFLLEGVAGDPDLNLPDGIHPNKEGQRILADTVWESIRPLL